MSQIAIGCFSRNNYSFFEGFQVRASLTQYPTDVPVFNVDDFSDPDDVKQGREICLNNKIIFLQNETRGLQHSIDVASRWMEQNYPEVKWLVVFQTDCYLFGDYRETMLEALSSGDYDDYGMVGFNIAAEDCSINPRTALDLLQKGENPMFVVGRSPIVKQPNIHWYRPTDLNMSSWPTDRPIPVEITNWMATALNLRKYREHIVPTDRYHMIYAWDDVAIQFLQQNVPNCSLPWIYGTHIPSTKKQFGMMSHAATAIKLAWEGNEEANRIIGNARHQQVWKDRWYGWEYDHKHTFDTADFEKSELMMKFREHDLTTGPVEL